MHFPSGIFRFFHFPFFDPRNIILLYLLCGYNFLFHSGSSDQRLISRAFSIDSCLSSHSVTISQKSPMDTPTSRITRSSQKNSQKSEMNASQDSQGVQSKRLVLHHAAIGSPQPAVLDVPINISDVQGLKPIYSADEYWHAKINIISDYDIIDFLNQNLPPRVIEKFRKTVFGNFLEPPTFRTSKQLIHSLLLRELAQPETDCICLQVGGKILYFGLEYFLLISGLKAVAEDGFQPFETGAATKFCKKYFGKKNEVKKADIEALLKNDGNGKNKFESDKDCLRMALVYFISYFLMGCDPNVRIPSMYFDCVKTGEYAKAAWGYLSFQKTIYGLKKNGKRKKRPGSYRLEGCPFIFELWFFEVCGACQGLICDRNQVDCTEFRPRMFRWKTSIADFRRSMLDDKIFNKNAKDLHFKKIEATDLEIEILSLQQYFPLRDPLRLDHQDVFTQGIDDQDVYTQGMDDQDVYTPRKIVELPSSSRSQTNNRDAVLDALASLSVQMQQGFHELNKKIDKSFKRIDAMEKTLRKITAGETPEKEKENMATADEKENIATEDESETMTEGEKDEDIDHNNAELEENDGKKFVLVQEKTGQRNTSSVHDNNERSLILYKPLNFQKIADADFDSIARFNIHLITQVASKDVSFLSDNLDNQDHENHVTEDMIDAVQEQEQVAVADNDKLEVNDIKPAEVNAVKVEKRERDAASTLESLKDMEGEDAVQIIDEDIEKTCKRRKIDEFDSVAWVYDFDK